MTSVFVRNIEQQSQGSISEGEDDLGLEYLGWFPGSIVGVRYYRGQVNRNEMVILRREPRNIYDRWAVRVDNLYGEQVGHLPRDLVAHLSPLIDSGKLALEASLSNNVTNVYRLPITIDCFGKPEDLPEINRALDHASCYLRNSPRGPAGSASSDRRSSFPGARPTPVKAPAVSSVRLSPEEVAKRLDTLFDTILTSSEARVEQEPAQIVTTPLYPHQKEALAWMMEREDCDELPVFWDKMSPMPTSIRPKYVHTLANFVTENRPPAFKGGILADDMGLGKTLTTIALIATQRFKAGIKSHSNIQTATTKEAKGPSSRKRSNASSEKSMTKKTKRNAGGQSTGGTSQPSNDMTKIHGPTLILCPLSVLPVWQEQLASHVEPSAMSVLTYYGSDRNSKAACIKEHDVVLSTYGTLVSEANWSDNSDRGLLAVEWMRVVADEAHIAKNPTTITAKTLHRLKASIRWALTGTPLQNSLRDLRGLLMFLKVNPLDNVSLFQRIIERPVNNGDPEGLRRLKVLVNTLALRRTKDTERKGAPLVTLPSKTVFLVTLSLESSALAKYQKWESAGRKLISRLLESGTLLMHYTNVLEILLRLRQICCDPSLVSDEQTENALDSLMLQMQMQVGRSASLKAPQPFTAEEKQRLIGLLRAGLDDECPVCLSEILDPCITACAHIFCKGCIHKVLKFDKAMCPLCRGIISSSSQILTLPPLPEEEPDPFQDPSTFGTQARHAATSSGIPPSQKTQALIARLQRYWSVTPEEKHVIFSQFTGMLDRVGAALESAGIDYYRLDGKTSVERRSEIVKAFSAQNGKLKGPRVLLLSLKVGGVGLNLTAANHAHILDPWWNPSVEEQAADRIHRLGQRRPVHIHRYIVKDSIEERMLALQEQKRELMKLAFDMARRRAEDVRAMRVRDIRMLMNIENDG